MKKQELFWQTYMNIEKSILELSKYIYFTDVKMENHNGVETEISCSSQLDTYSPYIADLLLQTCVQIEAISKELYFDIGGNKARGDSSILFDVDCLKAIDIKWRTHEKTVFITSPSFNLTKDESRIIRPLKNAHKRQGVDWNRAYQAVKHDRYTSLHRGNVKALLHAAAALYLLNLYYRNESWIVSYNNISKTDVSLGSAIFSVELPLADQLWYDNTPRMSSSPYVVTYMDEQYQIISTAINKGKQALEDFWKNQPEIQDPSFQHILEEAKKRDGRVMGIMELGKYRLNKKIDKKLPFDKRKELLITSVEWNSLIHQSNTHLSPSDITEDNIDTEIDEAGLHWGIGVTLQYQNTEWFDDAINKEWCVIRIG